MINTEALFKVSYGIYIVCSGNKEQGNGYISNTVFQVTAEPVRFASCCSKKNYTSELISKTGSFSVSVLHTDVSPEIFGKFGYKSGKDIDKLKGMQIKYGLTGVPILLEGIVAFLECKVIDTIDVGTHLIFIGELVQSEIIDDSQEPMTYQYYRQVRKGLAPKNAPTFMVKTKPAAKLDEIKPKKFRCNACGFIYDESVENIKFADLSPDWVCPVCGSEKEDFTEIISESI
ncbi:MAG: flavin reductase [Bacteroidia bacterium]|nr:flavin reductase [Bacteroidia bacterium]